MNFSTGNFFEENDFRNYRNSERPHHCGDEKQSEFRLRPVTWDRHHVQLAQGNQENQGETRTGMLFYWELFRSLNETYLTRKLFGSSFLRRYFISLFFNLFVRAILPSLF